MRLYDISEELRAVIEGGFVIDDESGEILFDSENVEDLRLEFIDKLDACACVLKDLEADAEAIKAERDRLNKRLETAKRKADRLKSYMLDCMVNTGTKSVTTARNEIRCRTSKAVEVDEDMIIPDQYATVRQTITPNKMKIRKAIENGADLPFAEIVERRNLIVK